MFDTIEYPRVDRKTRLLEAIASTPLKTVWAFTDWQRKFYKNQIAEVVIGDLPWKEGFHLNNHLVNKFELDFLAKKGLLFSGVSYTSWGKRYYYRIKENIIKKSLDL